jgi:formamidopyrimidine-DNA glycosylase
VPELPDLTIYIEALHARLRGERLTSATIVSPFVVRSVDPPLASLAGRSVTGLRRVGKRIVLEFGSEFLVIHLMVAGRLQWQATAPKVNRRLMLALFHFATGTLVLTEASQKKRAAIHVVRGADGLEPFARGGLEPLDISEGEFAEAKPQAPGPPKSPPFTTRWPCTASTVSPAPPAMHPYSASGMRTMRRTTA